MGSDSDDQQNTRYTLQDYGILRIHCTSKEAEGSGTGTLLRKVTVDELTELAHFFADPPSHRRPLLDTRLNFAHSILPILAISVRLGSERMDPHVRSRLGLANTLAWTSDRQSPGRIVQDNDLLLRSRTRSCTRTIRRSRDQDDRLELRSDHLWLVSRAIHG
jgi:hypothetical protein